MPIFRPAFQALQQNYKPLLFYMGIALLLSSGRLAVDTYVFHEVLRDEADSVTRASMLGVDILMMAIIALAQTIAFSRMGREIDRPMWRISTDREALVLFYKLWLLLALGQLTTEMVLFRLLKSTDDASAQLMLIFLEFFLIVILTPIGSAIMFYGRVGRQEIGQAFSTMLNHLPTTLMIALIGVLFAMLLSDLQLDLPRLSIPALAVAGVYVDSYLFVAMWLVCIHHRDDFDDVNDDDFNF